MAGASTRASQVLIQATPEAVWDAVTAAEWNQKSGYEPAGGHDRRPVSARPSVLRPWARQAPRRSQAIPATSGSLRAGMEEASIRQAR